MSINKEILEKKFPDINLRNEINLSLRKIQQIEKCTFNELKQLKEIDLSWNELKQLDEIIFSELFNLNKIYLYSNHLVKINKDLFKNLVNLSDIDLSWNQLEEIDKDIFKGLINLSTIVLYRNQIKNLDSSIFDGLYNLKIIYLNNNQLSEIDKNLFNSLTNLKELFLSSNKIKQIHAETFKGLTNLSKLDLSNNQIEYLEPNLFQSLINLEELDVSHNFLENVDKFAFKGLFNLVKICMHKNRLQKVESKNTLKFLLNSQEQIELYLEESVKFISLGNESAKNNINMIIKFMNNKNSPSVLNRLISIFKSNQTVISTFSSESNSSETDSPQRIQIIRNTNGTDIYGNKYKKINLLGGGSYGKVFKVESISTPIKILAMKEIIIKKEFQKNILNSDIMREAKLLKQLKTSPHIIQYEDCFFDLNGECFFIVTEFCADGDLEKKIKNNREKEQEFEKSLIYLWSKEMILGLDFLHRNKIIHRDIKPANIFLQNGHVKLGDLGEAKCILLSVADTFKGTFKYMSPEMVNTNDEKLVYSSKTDIWAAGVIIYELITLEYPFKESWNLMVVIDSIKNDPVSPILSETSDQMKHLINRMLQKNQIDRAEAKELLEILDKME